MLSQKSEVGFDSPTVVSNLTHPSSSVGVTLRIAVPADNRIRILLADRGRLYSHATKSVLENAGFHVAGDANDGWEAVRKAHLTQPDIVLLDVFMPLLNGFDAAREILRLSPRTKIALFTTYMDGCYIREALRAGISGYISKKVTSEVLTEAIRDISRGATWLCAEAVKATMDKEQLGRSANSLSLRERQILQLIAEGQATKEIGATLGISVRTVEAHRHRMATKLGMRGTAHLVRYAVRHGIVPA